MSYQEEKQQNNQIILQNAYKNALVNLNSLGNSLISWNKTNISPRIRGFSEYSSYQETKHYTYIRIEDHIPPKVGIYNNIGTDYHEAAKELWRSLILGAVDGQKRVRKYNKAMVLINVQHRYKKDPDNYFVKLIIDDLGYAGILPPDDSDNLSYLVKGKRVLAPETEHTEIYIIDYDHIIETLEKVLV